MCYYPGVVCLEVVGLGVYIFQMLRGTFNRVFGVNNLYLKQILNAML